MKNPSVGTGRKWVTEYENELRGGGSNSLEWTERRRRKVTRELICVTSPRSSVVGKLLTVSDGGTFVFFYGLSFLFILEITI